MGIPKSATKARKLAKKRQRKREARKRRMEKGPRERNDDLLFTHGPSPNQPAGKMSDMLTDLIEPYVDEIGSSEELNTFLSLAVHAWNIALDDDPSNRARRIEETVQNGAQPGATQEGLRAVHDLLEELVQRKLERHPRNQRAMIDYVAEEDGDGWYIQVISTL